MRASVFRRTFLIADVIQNCYDLHKYLTDIVNVSYVNIFFNKQFIYAASFSDNFRLSLEISCH